MEIVSDSKLLLINLRSLLGKRTVLLISTFYRLNYKKKQNFPKLLTSVLPELRVIRTTREAGSGMQPGWGYTAHSQINDPLQYHPGNIRRIIAILQDSILFHFGQKSSFYNCNVGCRTIRLPCTSGIASQLPWMNWDLLWMMDIQHWFTLSSRFTYPPPEAVKQLATLYILLWWQAVLSLIREGEKVTAPRTPGSPPYGTPMTEQSGQDGKDAKLWTHSQMKSGLQQ